MRINVIIILFSFTSSKPRRHVSFQRMCPCLCDRFLSFCVRLSTRCCFAFRCVRTTRVRRRASLLAAYTPCQTSRLPRDRRTPRSPCSLGENERVNTQGQILHVQSTEVESEGPRYLLCSDCAHRGSSGPARWSFRMEGCGGYLNCLFLQSLFPFSSCFWRIPWSDKKKKKKLQMQKWTGCCRFQSTQIKSAAKARTL